MEIKIQIVHLAPNHSSSYQHLSLRKPPQHQKKHTHTHKKKYKRKYQSKYTRMYTRMRQAGNEHSATPKTSPLAAGYGSSRRQVRVLAHARQV